MSGLTNSPIRASRRLAVFNACQIGVAVHQNSVADAQYLLGVQNVGEVEGAGLLINKPGISAIRKRWVPSPGSRLSVKNPLP